MTQFYVDSSVLVALLLEQHSHKVYSNLLSKSEGNYSSFLLEAEVSAAAAREKVSPDDAEEFIDLISQVIPERSLRMEYRQIFQAGFCRGADACHLATALYLDPETKNLTFLTADKEQAGLARAVGFKVILE